MERLEECAKTLTNDLQTIEDNFLHPLKKDEENLVRDNKCVPLCEVTRLYRLQVIVNTFSGAVDSLKNFIEDREVGEKAPEDIIQCMEQDMEVVTIQMHSYCNNEITPLFLSATLPGNKGQVVEKKIASLHSALEKILHVLKKAAEDLHGAGVVPACDSSKHGSEPEPVKRKPKLNMRNRSKSDTKVVRQSSLETMRPALKRTKSFMSSDVIKTMDKKGQMNVHTTVLADVLLKQLPLKY